MASYIPSKGVHTGLKDEADGELCLRILRVTTPLPHISPGIWLGENRQVQQTPGSFSSVVMKMAID